MDVDDVVSMVPLPSREYAEKLPSLADVVKFARVGEMRVFRAVKGDNLSGLRVWSNPPHRLEYPIHLLLVQGELGEAVNVIKTMARQKHACSAPV
jgi:hypothetical protein